MKRYLLIQINTLSGRIINTKPDILCVDDRSIIQRSSPDSYSYEFGDSYGKPVLFLYENGRNEYLHYDLDSVIKNGIWQTTKGIFEPSIHLETTYFDSDEDAKLWVELNYF